MKPRAAGTIGIVVALALAVLGGYLLARPPWSIPGALVLVLASIALCVSVVWTGRKSWSEPWPPHTAPSLEKQVRRTRARLFASVVLLTASVALTVVAVMEQYTEQLFVAGLLILSSVSNVFASRATLRALGRQLPRDA